MALLYHENVKTFSSDSSAMRHIMESTQVQCALILFTGQESTSYAQLRLHSAPWATYRGDGGDEGVSKKSEPEARQAVLLSVPDSIPEA